MAVLIDSYASTNKDSEDLFITGGGYVEGAGQAITFSRGVVITSVKFWLERVNFVGGGNAYARIYACTGTPNTNGKPTGSALFSSSVRNINTIGTTYGFEEWTFSGASLGAGNYCVVLEIDNLGDMDNYVRIGYDGSSPGSTTGNYCRSAVLTTWNSVAGDLIFEIYGGYPVATQAFIL